MKRLWIHRFTLPNLVLVICTGLPPSQINYSQYRNQLNNRPVEKTDGPSKDVLVASHNSPRAISETQSLPLWDINTIERVGFQTTNSSRGHSFRSPIQQTLSVIRRNADRSDVMSRDLREIPPERV